MDHTGHWLLWSWRKLIATWELLLSKAYECYEERRERKMLELELALEEEEEMEIEIEEPVARKLRASSNVPRLSRSVEVDEEEDEIVITPEIKPIIKTIIKPVHKAPVKPRVIDASAQGLPS